MLFFQHISLSLYSLVPVFGAIILLIIASIEDFGGTYTTGVSLRETESKLFKNAQQKTTYLLIIPLILFVFFFESGMKVILCCSYLIIAIFISAFAGKLNAKEAVRRRIELENLEKKEQLAREEGVYFKK